MDEKFSLKLETVKDEFEFLVHLFLDDSAGFRDFLHAFGLGAPVVQHGLRDRLVLLPPRPLVISLDRSAAQSLQDELS